MYSGYLYWSGWLSKDVHKTKIGSCYDLHSLSSCDDTVITTGLRQPMDLRVYGTGIHTTGGNQCSTNNGGCSHLCLPTPSGRVCQCPEGVSLKYTDPTTCEGVTTCAVLNAPQHGSISTCGHHEGNICRMSCNQGYTLSGSGTRQCQSDGTWSGTQTTCTLISCPVLSTPANADLLTPSCGNLTGAQCVFQCKTGYNQTSGNAKRTCQTDGRWDGQPLSCFIVKCPPLSTPINGSVSPSKCANGEIDYNTYCTFSCAPGYQVNGPISKHCLNNGHWSQQDQQVTCLDIENPVFTSCPSNQTVYAPSGRQKATVTWMQPKAIDNSGIAPSITTTMNSPQVFNEGVHHVVYIARDSTGNKAFCSFSVHVKVLRCTALASPPNGYLSSNCGIIYGSTCQIFCKTGYKQTGSAQRTCQATNDRPPTYWDGTDTKCTAITCVALGKPANGQNTCSSGGSTLQYGTTCHFSCDLGFSSNGTNTRTCQLNSTWSGSLFTCTAIHCPRLPPLDNGDISPSSCTKNTSQYNQQCTFSCGTGYHLIGTYTKTCTSNGTWSHGIAACKDIMSPEISNCPSSQSLTSGSCANTTQVSWIEPTASDNSGTVEMNSNIQPPVTLKEGFHIIEYQAQDPSGNNASCIFHYHIKRISCPKLNAPNKGSIRSQSCQNWFGSTTQLQCGTGYIMYGSAKRQCQATGQWSGSLTSCTVITCQPLQALLHGVIVPNTCMGPSPLPYNTTCTFMCDVAKGFQLSGPQNTKCQIDGKWPNSTSNVKCEDIQRPTISCPDAIIAETDPGKDSTTVSWSEPTVHDNAHQPGNLTLTSNHPEYSPPVTLKIGSYAIVYNVSDAAGHSSSCTLQITIKDNEAPLITCPEDMNLITPERVPTVSIKAPSITDNHNQIGYIQLYMNTNESLGHWTNLNDFPIDKAIIRGEHDMRYIVTDKSGNHANCTFDISIASIPCSKLQSPDHGSMACHKGKYLHFCTPHCDANYQFAAQPASAYFCSDNGLWYSNHKDKNIPTRKENVVPDCSEEESPEYINLHPELHYAGNCSDENAIKKIKENFIELVKTTFFYKNCKQSTQDDVSCEVDFDKITVECTSTTNRTRRSTTVEKQMIILKTDIRIAVGEKADANVTALNYAQSFETSFKETFNQQGNSDVIIDVGYTLECKPGHTLIGSVCLSCPLGHYLINGSCHPCPKDEYQDELGQITCKVCPEGTSTMGNIAVKYKSKCTGPSKNSQVSKGDSLVTIVVSVVVVAILLPIFILLFVKRKNSRHNRKDTPNNTGCVGLQRTESTKSLAFDMKESQC